MGCCVVVALWCVVMAWVVWLWCGLCGGAVWKGVLCGGGAVVVMWWHCVVVWCVCGGLVMWCGLCGGVCGGLLNCKQAQDPTGSLHTVISVCLSFSLTHTRTHTHGLQGDVQRRL